MKTYIGIKQIDAKPMNRGDYNIYRGWQIPADENPADEGYLVKYPDGYESWSPKEVFEGAYREKETNPLAVTALEMISREYKDRFKAEYEQLSIRYNRLLNMVKKWDKGELDFEPDCPRWIYDKQLNAMAEYLSVLDYRAGLEKIWS